MDPWPQVQDLIQCFPDEDEHLQKFCQWHPKSMLVKELVTMMQCPPPAEPWIPRVRESESERRSGRCMTWMETESKRERESERERAQE